MDQKLLLLINRAWTSPAADRFMAVMSCLEIWMPVILATALAAAFFGKFRARAFLFTACLILTINDSILSNSLKHIIHRLRPHQALSAVRTVDLARARPRLLALAKPLRIMVSTKAADSGQGRSFPSAHAVNTMTVATVAALFYPQYCWLYFLVPIIVGYSRIYVGAHWPSDVLASFFIGGASALLLAALARRMWQGFGSRLLPQTFRRYPILFAAS